MHETDFILQPLPSFPQIQAVDSLAGIKARSPEAIPSIPNSIPKDTLAGIMSIQAREQPTFRFSDADTSLNTVGSISLEQYTGTQSLFTEHALQPEGSTPVPLAQGTPDWFTIVLLLIVIGFTYIRVFYYKILKQLITAFFSNNVSNQVVRDENILVQRASIMLSFIFYLSASLFVYQLSVYFNWDYPILSTGFLRFLIISLLIAFSYSFKMVLLKGLGEVFDIDRAVATYIFNIFLINNILGLMLIPIVVLIAFMVLAQTQTIIYGGIALVIISFIYRLLRAFRIWLSMQNVSFFYLILYFCTLEIAPLLIIVKIAQG